MKHDSWYSASQYQYILQQSFDLLIGIGFVVSEEVDLLFLTVLLFGNRAITAWMVLCISISKHMKVLLFKKGPL